MQDLGDHQHIFYFFVFLALVWWGVVGLLLGLVGLVGLFGFGGGGGLVVLFGLAGSDVEVDLPSHSWHSPEV